MVLKTKEVKQVEFENIPSELIDINMWVIWKSELEIDKNNNEYYTKVPYQTNGIHKASVADKNTWSTFEAVKEAYENGIGQGIGLVINESHNIYVLDIDDTTESEHFEHFKHATYCEYSPSGNGIHVYMIGEKPKEHYKKVDDLELFSTSGFVTVTGHHNNDIDYVADLDSHIDHLIKQVFEKVEYERPTDLGESPKMSDAEIIALCEKAKNKDKFKALYYDGDISFYNDDESSADAGLASILALYTQNVSQIERIMRQSALHRDKWDRRESYPYIMRTIDFSLSQLTSVYKPKFNYSFTEGIQKSELKKTLRKRRSDEIKKAVERWEADDKKGPKPSRLSPVHCASIITEYIPFILMDDEENTRVMMYRHDEGIYTRNRTIINRVLSWLEYTLTERQADNVLYHIKNNAEIKPLTESRYLIPVKNGVFNLEKKQLEAFTPDYVFTSKIDTKYVENPPAPNINGWNVEEWIKEIACYDAEVVRLLWQVINDSLNGNYTRKKAIFLVGEGNNGKGTYQELLSNLIGSNNIATLKANEFDERFRLSVLQGKTAVIGDDVPPNVYIDDSSNLKSVITGDAVSVEQKNQPLYSAVFKCTVIQSTNGMPKFRDKTVGVLRRFIIVPFKADFESQEENTDIKEDFIKRPEVLEYVLNKAINLNFETFDIPKVSRVALDEFKQDNDPVYEFKSDVFDTWNIPEVPKSLVYAYYKEFCEENGYKYLSVRKFHNEFKKHLNPNWQTETQAKFTEEKLNRYIGNIKDNKYVEWNYPDTRKPYKTYKQDLLKAV